MTNAALMGACIVAVAAIGRPAWLDTRADRDRAWATYLLALVAVLTVHHWAGALAVALRPVAEMLGASVPALVMLTTATALLTAGHPAGRLLARRGPAR